MVFKNNLLIYILVFSLFTCKNAVNSYKFCNTKINKCIELNLNNDWKLCHFDPADLNKYYEIKLDYNHLTYKYYTHSVKLSINLDSLNWNDYSKKGICQSLKDDPEVTDIYICNNVQFDKLNFNTAGYSKKYRGYNIIFESFYIDSRDSTILWIKSVTYNNKINIALIKQNHFDLLKNLNTYNLKL